MKNKIKTIIVIIVFTMMVILAVTGTALAAFTTVPQFLWYDLNTLRANCGLAYLRFSCCAAFVVFVIGIFWLISAIIHCNKPRK